MEHRHRAAIRVLALAAACAVAPNASAQRASGPFAGLFGGTQPSSKESPQTLDLRWSLYEGFDDVGQDAFGRSLDPKGLPSGVYGGLSADLGYARDAGAARVRFSSSVMARSYGASFNLSAPIYMAGGSVDLPLGRRTRMRSSFGASYASFYQFVPFLAMLSTDATTLTPGYGSIAAPQASRAVFGSVGIGQQLGKRASLSGDVGLFQREFTSGDQAPIGVRRGQIMFQQGLTRDLGFHAGYGFTEGRFARGAVETGNPSIRNFDIGIDYNKALSFSRKTTLRFGSGSSVAQSGLNSQYHLNLQAVLTTQLGRTWSGSIAYSRGAQFVEGLRDVVSSDSVVGTVNGLLSSRAEWDSSFALSSGIVGLKKAPGFGAYSASSKFSIALARSLGLFVQYTYYRYDVAQGSALALDLTPRLDRRAAMIGLSGWVPFVGDSRGRSGSR